MGRPSGREVWLERQMEAYRVENIELTRDKELLEEHCLELTRQVNLLDRMRIAAVCRQAIHDTKRRNPCHISARLEVRAINKVVSDCEEELERFRQWRQKAARSTVKISDGEPSLTPTWQDVSNSFDSPWTVVYGSQHSSPWVGFNLAQTQAAHAPSPSAHDLTVDLEAGYGPGPNNKHCDPQKQINDLQSQVKDLSGQLVAAQTAASRGGALDEVVAVLQDRLGRLEGLAEERGSRQDGALTCEQQQVLIHENRRLQSELARAEAKMQEVKETSAAAQLQMHRSIEQSDAMIEAALAKMAAIQDATRKSIADIGSHISTGAFTLTMMRQKVEALQQEIILSDVPDAAPFGSSAARMFDPAFLRRIARHADAIASQINSLTAQLDESEDKVRNLMHSLNGTKAQSDASGDSCENKPPSPPSRQHTAKPFNPNKFSPPLEKKPSHHRLSVEHRQEAPRLIKSANAGLGSQEADSHSMHLKPSTINMTAHTESLWTQNPMYSPSCSGRSGQWTPSDLDSGVRPSEPSEVSQAPAEPLAHSSTPTDGQGSFSSLVAQLKQHTSNLDTLLSGKQDEYVHEDLLRLRSTLQHMLEDTQGASTDMDALRTCLENIMAMVSQRQQGASGTWAT